MKKILFGALAALLFLPVMVLAQSTGTPSIGAMPNQVQPRANDLFADVVGGKGTAQSAFVTAGQLNSQFGALVQVPLTAFTITVPNNVGALLMIPAGTLAAGTINLPAAPVDQQMFRLVTTQLVTALVVAAPAGQTIGGTALTAPAINTEYTWMYIQNTNTWQRITQG